MSHEPKAPAARNHRGLALARASVATLASMVVVVALGPGAVAAPRPTSEIRILPVALLEGGGSALTVTMLVRCPPSDHVREGFVGAAQDGAGFLIGYQVVCDGHPHLTQAVFAASDAGLVRFHRGDADVHAVIFDEATGTSISEQERTVMVRGPISGG